MMNRVLFLDDKKEQLPALEYRRWLKNEFAIEAEGIQTTDPVSTVLEKAKKRVALAGALVDKCEQDDFEHIRQLRLHFPGILIGLYSSRVTNHDKNLAYRAGADACFQKGEPLDAFCKNVADDYQGAKRRFRDELPSLLSNPANLGRWAAYTRERQLGLGNSDLALILEYEKRFAPKQFIVVQVLPDLDPLEETESWHSIAM